MRRKRSGMIFLPISWTICRPRQFRYLRMSFDRNPLFMSFTKKTETKGINDTFYIIGYNNVIISTKEDTSYYISALFGTVLSTDDYKFSVQAEL